MLCERLRHYILGNEMALMDVNYKLRSRMNGFYFGTVTQECEANICPMECQNKRDILLLLNTSDEVL